MFIMPSQEFFFLKYVWKINLLEVIGQQRGVLHVFRLGMH
jgi:hypothetical protein